MKIKFLILLFAASINSCLGQMKIPHFQIYNRPLGVPVDTIESVNQLLAKANNESDVKLLINKRLRQFPNNIVWQVWKPGNNDPGQSFDYKISSSNNVKPIKITGFKVTRGNDFVVMNKYDFKKAIHDTINVIDTLRIKIKFHDKFYPLNNYYLKIQGDNNEVLKIALIADNADTLKINSISALKNDLNYKKYFACSLYNGSFPNKLTNFYVYFITPDQIDLLKKQLEILKAMNIGDHEFNYASLLSYLYFYAYVFIGEINKTDLSCWLQKNIK